MEWPNGETEPGNYWLFALPPECLRNALVDLAKRRWRIERDYREPKQGLELVHCERTRLGQVERHPQVCKRHRTPSLLLALDVMTGAIIGTHMSRHRARVPN